MKKSNWIKDFIGAAHIKARPYLGHRVFDVPVTSSWKGWNKGWQWQGLVCHPEVWQASVSCITLFFVYRKHICLFMFMSLLPLLFIHHTHKSLICLFFEFVKCAGDVFVFYMIRRLGTVLSTFCHHLSFRYFSSSIILLECCLECPSGLMNCFVFVVKGLISWVPCWHVMGFV